MEVYTATWKIKTHRNLTMFSWSSLLKCFMLVSCNSLTFLIATILLLIFPENTAPCAPLPIHSMSKKLKKILQLKRKSKQNEFHNFHRT